MMLFLYFAFWVTYQCISLLEEVSYVLCDSFINVLFSIPDLVQKLAFQMAQKIMRTPTNDTPMQLPKQPPEEQLFIQPTMQQLMQQHNTQQLIQQPMQPPTDQIMQQLMQVMQQPMQPPTDQIMQQPTMQQLIQVMQ